jgi:hypothetical protein
MLSIFAYLQFAKRAVAICVQLDDLDLVQKLPGPCKDPWYINGDLYILKI